MRINRLFLRKIGVAFLVGFLPVLSQVATGLGPAGDVRGRHAVLVMVGAGALSAAVRAVFQAVPGLTLEPTDNEPILVRPTPPPG